MSKKLLSVVFALVLCGLAAEARDVVTLGLYLESDSIVKPVGTLPKGVFRGKPQKVKNGGMSFPQHIIVDQPQSVELKFEVVNGGKFSASLNAFRVEKDKPNQPISVKCKVFELNGVPVKGVPCTITKWRRMFVGSLNDGDTITVKLELEKTEE